MHIAKINSDCLSRTYFSIKYAVADSTFWNKDLFCWVLILFVWSFLAVFLGLFVCSESLRSFSYAGRYEKEEGHVTAKRHHWSSKSVQRLCWIVPKRSQGECQPWCQTDGEVADWAWPLCGGSIEEQEAEYGIGNDAWQNEKNQKTGQFFCYTYRDVEQPSPSEKHGETGAERPCRNVRVEQHKADGTVGQRQGSRYPCKKDEVACWKFHLSPVVFRHLPVRYRRLQPSCWAEPPDRALSSSRETGAACRCPSR